MAAALKLFMGHHEKGVSRNYSSDVLLQASQEVRHWVDDLSITLFLNRPQDVQLVNRRRKFWDVFKACLELRRVIFRTVSKNLIIKEQGSLRSQESTHTIEYTQSNFLRTGVTELKSYRVIQRNRQQIQIKLAN